MEAAAFSAAAEQYQDMVYRLSLSQLGNVQDAEDAVQEVFLRLYRQERPPVGDSLRYWLIRVTVNYCRDILRSSLRKRRISLTELAEPHAGPVFDRIEQRELFDAVIALPEKYRTVLHLYYYEGLTAEEIGKLQNRSSGTIRMQLSRARTMLKELLMKADADLFAEGGGSNDVSENH